MKTLVVALDSFGDQVLRQPFLSGLLDAGHDVTVAVRSGFERVLPLLDRRLRAHLCPFEYAKAPALDAARAYLEGIEALGPELVVSAQFDPVRYVSWILGRLPGVRAAGFIGGTVQQVPGVSDLEPELRLGAARPLDVPVPCDASLPELQKNSRLLAALTGQDIGKRPRLSLSPACLGAGSDWLGRHGLQPGAYGVCCPAGTANVRIKAWPPWRFARVSSWIRERGLPVLVMGHVFEAAIVDDVTRLMDGAGHPTFLGRDEDFELMASLLAHSRLYLGNDTGPMHMAAACGVPVVAIFGGGHWPRFLPAAETGAAHTQELGCFGCAWGPCVFGDAPCVGEVAEDAVRESVARVLDGRSGFQVRAQPPMPEEEVRARPLQRYHAATAEAARQIQGLVAPGAAEQVRAAFRACDEAVRRIALQAQRVDAERDSHEARAARQDAVIRGQVEEIVRLDAVSRRAPLVSVVTPTLNAARFLERCIASVLRQDYGRVEHIVVDGGSTDGTLDICSRHPHLVVCSATDRGRAEALNRGFAMARGDVFGWLGAGDEYLPRAISIAVDTILEGHDAVVGLCQLVDDEGRRVGPHPGNPTDDLDPRSLRRLQEAPEQAIFWRRRLWERAGPLQVGAPRTDLWLRMGRITRLHRIGADLAACRVRPGPGATAVKSKPARSRPLRLALFGARATGSTGERLVRRTAEALLARGHDARLYVRDAMPEEERPHYLRLLPDLPLLRRAEASFRYRTGLDDLFHPGTALLRFLPWLSSADVWHFHDLHGHYVSLPALAAASWTKPVLISPRDELLTTGRMKRASLRASRFRYLVHTRNLEVHHRAALPHASIRRLTHGVDVHAYRPVPRGDALRAVGLPDDGRLVAGAIPADVTDPRNGVSEALAALRSLASRHPGRLRLLLAGEGGQTLASPGDEDLDVRYVGVVKRDSDMAMLLGCCDVLVRPTRAEGPAFACLEALACGVPVVGYDCGGQREVVGDGVGGLLVAPEPGALAAAIERLMGDPALRLRLAAGARETAVRDFDLDRYVDELVGCYEELARRRPFNDGARNKSS